MKKHLVILNKPRTELQIVRTDRLVDGENLTTHKFSATREGWEKLTAYLDTQEVEGFSVTFDAHAWLVENEL